MYARRLTLALAALASAAVIEGMTALWALSVANNHVLRGRVASDIELAFKDLTIAKLRLQAWLNRPQQREDPALEQAQGYQSAMQSTLAHLRALSELAIALDGEPSTRSEQLQRLDALAVLSDGVAELNWWVEQAQRHATDSPPNQTPSAASELLDRARGRDVRQLLIDNIEREAAAVARERAGADQALEWMRRLLWGTAVVIALAAVLLTAQLTRALRRPLDKLNEGAKALQQGKLTHRIPDEGTDEFSAVARSMNAMAIELGEHRAREVQARQQLEAVVAARTTELQSTLDTLQQVEARRRQLFADISHELRTPTTAIMGEAEITLRGRDRGPEDYRTALHRIVATARQLGRIINDLLTMARSDIDALALDRRPTPLDDVLRQAIEQAQALAHARRITVQGPTASNPSLRVLADPQRLHQLLMVILDNAVRYSLDGGLVSVSLGTALSRSADPVSVWIRVTDQGIGIPLEEQSRLFERRYRGSSARQHHSDGSGLGLSISRALARAHGGDIELDSQQGCGTAVTLRLPLLPDALPEAL